ncbi:hypothetical protein [Prochlorococcus marinus]|uniref:hypothetical protein n=1 Tax=Prochlorococcus marinus TaxID=1219 RepID=UPI0022B3285A|nr:hypothetical protein [Prochlorococcus marinus]
MNYSLKLLLYVAGWIIAWYLFSSIINSGLIITHVYLAGSKGMAITFFITGIVSIAGGYSLYNETFSTEINNKSN